jgi:hypothetical protein
MAGQPLMLFELLHIVENINTPEELETLRSMTPDQLANLTSGLTRNERSIFILEMKIKLLGGVNNYIPDFILRNAPDAILTMPPGEEKELKRSGFIQILNRLRVYPGVSRENIERIDAALYRIAGASAPAAGGRRRKRKSKRKQGLTKKRTTRHFKRRYHK